MMNDNIGKILFEKLQELKDANGGNIDINNIDAVVEKFTEIIKSHVSSDSDLALYGQIQKISEEIRATKQGISDVDTGKMNEDFPDATFQLQSVTAATEKSTNIILTKIEEISALSSKIDNPEIKNKIQNNAIEIMEACNFQDITGQRINKVIKTLDDVEALVTKLIGTFKPKDDSNSAKKHKKTKEQELLNGPQLEGLAPTQSQIDDLFKNA